MAGKRHRTIFLGLILCLLERAYHEGSIEAAAAGPMGAIGGATDSTGVVEGATGNIETKGGAISGTTEATPSTANIVTSRCSYSFIVNEVNSNSECPTIIQKLQGDSPVPNTTATPQISGDISGSLETLTSRVQELENKLFHEMLNNRELNNTMGKQHESMRKIEHTIWSHHINMTQIYKAIKTLEHTVKKQKQYYKSVDHKLAGVMLDVVEVNNLIQKKLPLKEDINDKYIQVQSTSEVSTCAYTGNSTRYKDCQEILDAGHTQSGVYYVTPIYTNCPIPVWCDMDTPPGGWLIIQRRINGDVSFNRKWKEYRHGFGDVTKEYWLGNDNIFLLSNQARYKVRIDLWDFMGSRVFAEYSNFRIDGDRDDFNLHISNHTGTAPDGFTNHDGMAFSTPDRDNDNWPDYHCAREWGAGWWFSNCWFVILNGQYYNTTDVKYRGISWNDWKQEQLSKVEMKIKPADPEES